MKKFWSQHQVLIVLLLALLLRLPLLNGSFWLDEAAQALESARPFSQQHNIVQDFQPPLLHYLVHFALQISRGEWWLRLWGSLIPGLVTIWATYQLGKKLFNKNTAIAAALLLATSSFHIFFSQELRPYSLSAMWAMLGTLLIFSANFQWWKFALISVLGLYSSYLYPFLLLPQLWLVWQQKQNRKQLPKILGFTALFCAPWLPIFFKQLEAGQRLREMLPGWENVVSTPQAKALALIPLKFLYGVPNLEPTIYFILPALAVLLAMSFAWKPFITQKLLNLKNNHLKLLVLFLTPLLSSWLVSFVIPVIQPKRLLYLLPLFYLLAAFPLSQKKKAQSASIILIILLLAINLYGTWQYWTNPFLQRENWRGLQQNIAETFPASDTIAVFAFDEAFSPWGWYSADSIPTLSVGGQISNDLALRETLETTDNYRYVLVFDYLRDLTDPENKLLPAVENFGLIGRGVIDFPNIGFVRIYSKPEYTIGYRP